MLAALLLCAPTRLPACEAGVCDGTVTADGRPICWKLRVQISITNDLHYFAAGVEHFPGLGPADFSYLGVGPYNDDNGGPARQGINAQGLALGFNAYNGGDWEQLHHQALGWATTVDDVDGYVRGMTTLGTIHYAIDAQGSAVLWENDLDPSAHWTYDVQAPARVGQHQDFDGDGDKITYAGWIGRANTIFMRTDGSDSLLYGEDDRTAAAQTVPGRLIDAGTLDIKTLAREYFRHDTLARDFTVSSMIVHGVLPGEDPRLTTMWTALGHSEGAIFVPVWLHGVEADTTCAVPQHLEQASGACVFTPARGLITTGTDETELQARTLPVEGHFFDVVTDLLLPAWRARNWQDPAVVTAIGAEMKRVQDRMDEDAYSLLNGLYTGDDQNQAPWTSSIDGWTSNGLSVEFAVTATDPAGTVATTFWDYGDGETGDKDNHTYAQAGTYLAAFTVVDDDGASFTDWAFVTVTDPSPVVDGTAVASPALVLHGCFPNPCNPTTTIAFELDRRSTVDLAIFDAAGRCVRRLHDGTYLNAGTHTATWSGRDDAGRALPSGVYFCWLASDAGCVTRTLTLLK